MHLRIFKNKVFHNFDEAKLKIGKMDKMFASSLNKKACRKISDCKISLEFWKSKPANIFLFKVNNKKKKK